MSGWAVGSNQHKKIPAVASPPVAAPHAAAAAGADPMAKSGGRQARIAARRRLNEAVAALGAGGEDGVLLALYAVDDADHALTTAASHYPDADADAVVAVADPVGAPVDQAGRHLRAAVADLRGRAGMDDHGKASALRSARARIGAARELLAPLVGG